MITGKQTLQNIEGAISDAQRQVSHVQNELKESNEKKTKLLAARVKAYRELAEFKVKDALSDNVIDETDNLSHKVGAILSARNKTINELRERIKNTKDNRKRLLKSHAKCLDEIAAAENKLDDFAKRAERQLMKDPDFAELNTGYKELKKTHEHAKAKTEQSEKDREEKGKPYQDDPLFMYLWKRKYGTKTYSANSVISMLDDWVAKLVKYHGARANYAVLIQIPERLNDHLEHLEKQLKEKQAVIDEQKNKKIAELANTDLMANLQDLRKKEVLENREIENSDAELEDITAQLNTFLQGRDHSFKNAIDMVTESLEFEDFNDLLYEARQTHDPKDDQILERLKAIEKEMEFLEEKMDDQKDDLQRLFKRKRELTRISSDFRRNHYDDPGSVFTNSGNYNNMLNLLLTGAVTAAEYWMRTQSNQRWRSRPADPFRHSSHLPPFGGDFGGHDRRHDSWGDAGGSDDWFGNDDFMSDGGF